MTDPQETSDTVEQLVDSDGGGRIRPAAPTGGQSVGGPAAASESATEAALTGSDDPVIGNTPAADDPARNPL
ncbi:MAG TPA: hypothetical protein VH084_13610 [Mycobacterium sp.]|jgi:hypothetical protein|nr:hypothetical protein [Mycobacterium sp.]